MVTKNEYQPDVVSWPGETLAEVLAEHEMSQAELAARMGRPKQTITEIIQGQTDITPETALQLEQVLHIPATFWNNRQRQYQEYRASCLSMAA
jgi:addiction module HigA family antidote